jgi:hypothetical protein
MKLGMTNPESISGNLFHKGKNFPMHKDVADRQVQ